ncbi:MAG: sensor histidine kinase [bacterium]
MTLILYVVAPLALSLGLSGWIALATWERNVEERLQSDLEMVARAIQLPLSYAMERDREGGVEQALESALSLDSVYSAYAYDLEGGQIAAAGKEDPEPERDKLTELASEGERLGEYGQVGKRRVFSYFIPLTDSRQQSTGLLQLTRRERDFQRYISRTRKQALLLLCAGVLVMTALVVFGQQQALGRHFNRLTKGMKRIAAGESEHRMSLTGPREISAISASFNDMLDSIQGAEAEIRRNRQQQLYLEKQLRQTEKLAAVGQLAAGVAHELGTPLSTISGATQRELRRQQEDQRTAKAFQRIRTEVNRMEVIIRQLLDFSHKRELQCRTLRPCQIAESATSAVAEEAHRHGTRIEIDGDAETPTLEADPIRLEQALVNLLRNAIQACGSGTVRLGWRTEDKRMVFAVEDDGPGIPEEVRPRLFEPFFTTKNVGEGTGLGLAVVYGIVEEHDGDIQIDKSELGGTSVRISLPMTAQNKGKQS